MPTTGKKKPDAIGERARRCSVVPSGEKHFKMIINKTPTV